ncbi:MAG: hypothetical protein HYR52_07220 [Candidatus Tectomicrobia bacterium]|nr:hypothetical protein [Candidatus Tectomicrobia bacterium]
MGPLQYVGIAFLGGGLAFVTRPLFAQVRDPAGVAMGGGLMILLGLGCLFLPRFLKRRNP